MSQNKTVLAGVGMMAMLTVASKLVRLIVLMVTARFLTPEDFGIVAAFTMVLALAYLVAGMGLTKTIIQRPVINEAHIGGAIIISTTFSIIVFFTLIFASDYIEHFIGITGVGLPLQVSSFLFFLLGISGICSALFQRNGDIVFIGKVQAFCTIFGSICITIPLLWFDFGFWAIIVGILVAELLTLLVIFWQGKSFLKFSFAKEETYEVIKYSSAFFSHNLINLISKQIDIALVGRYLGKADLGYYSRSMQLIEFPSQIYWLVVDRVVFPTMSAMKADKAKLTQFFIDIYSLLLLPLCVGAIVLFFGATEIINVLMGEGWGIVIVLIEILAVNVVVKCLTGFIDSFLAAYGVIKALTYKNLLSLVIFSVAIFIGLDFGLTGVAYAVVLASVMNFFMSVAIAVFYVRISVATFMLASIPALSTSTFLTLLYSGISLVINVPDLVSILVSAMLWGLFCYCYPSAVLLSENGRNFVLKIKYKKNKAQSLDSIS
jgi:teichuronic acid exporter